VVWELTVSCATVAFIALMTCNYWLLTTGPTVVYVNEILPSQAREVGVGMCQVIPCAVAVALGQKWPLATEKLGAKSYLVLLCLSGVSFALNWWFVVEPKGLSIERIDVVSPFASLSSSYRMLCII
jgi:hypothetical protein